ncbi:MAG: hypothetical protein ABSA76_13445, partial [Bacteroidales bacterium]
LFGGLIGGKISDVSKIIAKARLIDHIWPVILQLTYITIRQALTPAFGGQYYPANYGQGHWLFHNGR